MVPASIERIGVLGQPVMVSRSEWRAEPPSEPYTPRGSLAFAVVHHTSLQATELLGDDPSEEVTYMKGIERGHRRRGFADIGYHLVVMPSGRVYRGRPLAAMGAHVLGHNRGTVGIALAGDFDVERPTFAALRSLHLIRASLGRRRQVDLVPHGALASTSCPGAFVERLLEPSRTLMTGGGRAA